MPLPRSRSVLLLLAAGLSIGLGGCKRSSDSETLSVASQRLIAATGNGTAGMSAADRATAYASVLAAAKEVESSTTNPGLKAAAAILGSRAMIGQGEVASEQCRDIRIQALLEIARLRSRALLRQDMLALGGALSVYDPTADLDELDDVSRQIAQEATQIRSRIDEVAARIDEVQARIGERMARTRQLREQDSTIRLAMADMTASQRASEVTRATGLRREADQLEMDAAELELQVGELENTRASLTALAESLDERAALLAGARARIQESASVLEQQAGEAQQAAAAFRSELNEGLSALLAGPLAEMLASHDEAISQFNSAASKAGAARSIDPTAAALSTAVAKQSAAHLHRNVAQTLALASALAQHIGAEDAASELNTRLEEINASAAEALDEAAGAFQSVRTRDSATSDGLNNLAESLQRQARQLRGEPEPEEIPVEDENAVEMVPEGESGELAPESTEEPVDQPVEEPDPELEPEADPMEEPASDPQPELEPEPAPEPELR